ncbi:FIST C-terminal domain-containing protein [Vibrio fluvialis]|nr:FIST C-terminal domain-containing protein [Vibrio fluvialis]MBY8048351.1 FIST C-terminal domain-containing protein [Vibrio fluvialis]
MRLITTFTQISDPINAVSNLKESLIFEGLSSLVFYYTDEYPADILFRSLKQAFPNIPFVGCSSCKGVMTEKGYHSGPVIAALAIYDAASSAYGTGLIGLEDDKDLRKSTRKAIQQALKSAGRIGEVPSLIILHATPGHEELFIDEIDDTFGTQIPIIGGSAADNYIQQQWSSMTEQGWVKNGLAVQLFFPSKPLTTGFSAGYSPTEFVGTVTKASGRFIHEIDGEPAKQIYKEWISDHSSVQISEHYLFHHVTRFPLGRVAGHIHQQPYYKLSHPVRMTRSGAMEMFTTVVEGETVTLMTGSREQLINRASRVVKEANTPNYHESQLLGSIIIYCAGSMLRLGDDILGVQRQLKFQMNGRPFICPFTFGEQGRFIGGENAHGNLMISSVLFYESE